MVRAMTAAVVDEGRRHAGTSEDGRPQTVLQSSRGGRGALGGDDGKRPRPRPPWCHRSVSYPGRIRRRLCDSLARLITCLNSKRRGWRRQMAGRAARAAAAAARPATSWVRACEVVHFERELCAPPPPPSQTPAAGAASSGSGPRRRGGVWVSGCARGRAGRRCGAPPAAPVRPGPPSGCLAPRAHSASSASGFGGQRRRRPPLGGQSPGKFGEEARESSSAMGIDGARTSFNALRREVVRNAAL